MSPCAPLPGPFSVFLVSPWLYPSCCRQLVSMKAMPRSSIFTFQKTGIRFVMSPLSQSWHAHGQLSQMAHLLGSSWQQIRPLALIQKDRFQAPNWPSGTECPLSSQSFLDQPWTKEAGKLIRIRALWSKKWSFFIVAWRTPFIWQVSTLFRVDGQKSPGAWQVMSREGHRVCS